MEAKNNNIKISIPSSGQLSVPYTDANSLASTPYAQGQIAYQPIYHPIRMSQAKSAQPSTPSYQNYMKNNDDVPPPGLFSGSHQGSSIHPEDTYTKDNNVQTPEKKAAPKKSAKGGMIKIKMPSLSLCKVKKSNMKKFLGCLLLIFTIVNLAVMIPLAVFYYRKRDINLTSVSSALAYMRFNLDQHPILDVQVQDDGTQCPENYYEILLGTWPGTTAGCDCPGSGLKSGWCDNTGDNPTDVGCDDIGPRKPIDMYDWGGSKWCVLRAKHGEQYNRSVECSAGFRKCSSGIYVLETLDCPVTEVKVSITGTNKLKLGTGRYVVTEKAQGKSPVIDLAITPNNVPCFSEGYFAAGPVRPYILINANEKGCSKYGLDDHYSFQLDNQTQDQLFYQNNFPSKVLDLPEYYPVYTATASVLSYRIRMDVDENDFCLNIDTGILEKSSKAAEDLNRFMKGTLLAALIIHGILFIFVGLVLIIMKCENSCGKTLAGDESSIWKVPCLIIGFLEFVDLVVMFAATSHFRKKMISTEDYMMKLVEMECFLDSQAHAVVTDYQALLDVVVQSLYAYSFSLFLVTTICVIPSFCFLLRYLKKCCQR